MILLSTRWALFFFLPANKTWTNKSHRFALKDEPKPNVGFFERLRPESNYLEDHSNNNPKHPSHVLALEYHRSMGVDIAQWMAGSNNSILALWLHIMDTLGWALPICRQTPALCWHALHGFLICSCIFSSFLGSFTGEDVLCFCVCMVRGSDWCIR